MPQLLIAPPECHAVLYKLPGVELHPALPRLRSAREDLGSRFLKTLIYCMSLLEFVRHSLVVRQGLRR